MEVFQTDNFYIFVKREKSLWWNRFTSEFTLKAGKNKVFVVLVNKAFNKTNKQVDKELFVERD